MTVHNMLAERGFIRINENYILKTTFGKIVLEKEFRINSRYTAMEYTMSTNDTTLSGIIYTNDILNFLDTLNRLISNFNLLEKKCPSKSPTNNIVSFEPNTKLENVC